MQDSTGPATKPQRVTISINPDTMAVLEAIATREFRSTSNQAAAMVEQAVQHYVRDQLQRCLLDEASRSVFSRYVNDPNRAIPTEQAARTEMMGEMQRIMRVEQERSRFVQSGGLPVPGAGGTIPVEAIPRQFRVGDDDMHHG